MSGSSLTGKVSPFQGEEVGSSPTYRLRFNGQ